MVVKFLYFALRILDALRRTSAKLDACFTPTELPTFVEKLFLW